MGFVAGFDVTEINLRVHFKHQVQFMLTVYDWVCGVSLEVTIPEVKPLKKTISSSNT